MPRVLKPAIRDITKCDRHNRYCGPAALSSMFGISTGEAAELLRHVGGRRAIRGAYNHEMLSAINLLKADAYEFRVWHLNPDGTEPRPRRGATLARFIVKRTDLRKELVLLNVTRHYVVVQGNRFCDNHTGKVVSTKRAPHRRKRIVRGWIIRPKGSPTLAEDLEKWRDGCYNGMKSRQEANLYISWR